MSENKIEYPEAIRTEQRDEIIYPRDSFNCTKSIKLYAYNVIYADLREEKPRAKYRSLEVIDESFRDACVLIGQNIADLIEAKYNRGGFHVISIEREAARPIAHINLRSVYQCAAEAAK